MLDERVKDPFGMKIYFAIMTRIERALVKHSLVGSTEFFDKALFPWVKNIEQNIEVLKKEMHRVLARIDDLPAFHEISPDQKSITTDEKWKIFPFYAYGIDNEEMKKECPETIQLLATIPGIKTAMYSILMPGKKIPPHRGPYRGILRLHISLLVPTDYQACRIRVGSEIRPWKADSCMIFDDGYEHQVWNDTQQTRVILFVDFLRPLSSKTWTKINNLIVNAIARTSLITEASKNVSQWYKAKWLPQKTEAQKQTQL